MSKTSTYVGVEYEASTKTWKATYVKPDGKVKIILPGVYKSQIEAALAFDKYARSVLNPQEASRVVNFTKDGAPNPNENLCRVVLDKIEEQISESNDMNGTNDSPPTKGTGTSPDLSYRFVSFLKTKLSNVFGFTSENNKQSNHNAKALSAKTKKNYNVLIDEKEIPKNATKHDVDYSKIRANIFSSSSSSIEDDDFVVDMERALREKSIVKTKSKETLKHVVKRLDLNVSANELLRLNKERYDGLTLKSQLVNGTLLLVREDVPLIMGDEDETVVESKIDTPRVANKITFDTLVELRTNFIGVFPHTNGQFVAHRAYKGKDYFSDTTYKTKEQAARASDALALALYKGNISKDVVLNFPSEGTASLRVNMTTTMPGVPFYPQDPKTGKFKCSCGKTSKRLSQHLGSTHDPVGHQRLIAFSDASEIVERGSHCVLEHEEEQEYRVCGKITKGHVDPQRFSGVFNTRIEAARAADAARLKMSGLEGASPLECMMKCHFDLNCPGENVFQGLVVVKSTRNNYTVKKLADTEVDEIRTYPFDPDDQELPSRSQIFGQIQKYLKICKKSNSLSQIKGETVRKHLEKHFDMSLTSMKEKIIELLTVALIEMIKGEDENVAKKRDVGVSEDYPPKQAFVKLEVDSSRQKKRSIDTSSVKVKREFKKLKSSMNHNLTFTKRRHTALHRDLHNHCPDKMYFFRENNLGVFPCFLPLKNVEPIFIGWADDSLCDKVGGKVLTCDDIYTRYNSQTGTRKSAKKWLRSWENMICEISTLEISKLHFWTFIVSSEKEQKSQKRLALVWCAAFMKILWRSHPDNGRASSKKNKDDSDIREIETEFSSLEKYVKRMKVSTLCSLLLHENHIATLLSAVQSRKRIENIKVLAQSVSEFIIRNLKKIMEVRRRLELSSPFVSSHFTHSHTHTHTHKTLHSSSAKR